jgi:PAS domain S-box-containing protein
MTAADTGVADFLSGTGEMGNRIRDFDWTATPLGPIESWPHSLKTSVSLILGSRHPMWIGWGPEMTFLYNDAYLHVLGPAKHHRALGRPASEVWAEIWDVCGPLADKVFGNGEASFLDDVQFLMDRGAFLEETFYSFSYSPIRDESGKVRGLFCPSTDVTPKVVNARRLRTLSQLATDALTEKTTIGACATAARTLSGNSDDIPFALLYLADAEGKTASLERIVGCVSPAAAIARRIDLRSDSNPHPWPVRDVFQTARRRTISLNGASGVAFRAADRPVSKAVILPVASRRDHTPYGVLIMGVNPCRPLDADHLTFFELVASQVATAIQNATEAEEEKKRADMLAEIDRAKTVFFSNVSHEFRTPLTLMLGPLENLLANPDRLHGEDREQLLIAHRNSLRLLKLVNSLLDFSRIEAGRMQASYLPTDLSGVTRDLASNFRSAMEHAGLQLIVDCGPLSEPVYVDREMWEKIVLNLLSNAFKFTFEGSVTVRLGRSGGNAVLTVADTGIGIPEEELPRIFERFHRVETAKGRTFEGTGIGLALIQELVKLHGGVVSVDSRLGKGATFTVSLPLGFAHLPKDRIGSELTGLVGNAVRSDAFIGEAMTWLPHRGGHAESKSAARPPRVLASAKQARILLTDDNADMREYVCRVLGSEYEVVTAGDGQEALEIIRREPPDLLLTDAMMPRMDGLDLLQAVRAHPPTQTLPVILLSARAGDEMRFEGFRAGADDYLVKPFTAGELRARVDAHLQMALLRRRAGERESALRAEAEAARDQAVSVIESITDAFMALDREWRITYVNAEAERLNRMGRDEMLGRNHWELFPAAVGTTVHLEFLRAVAERVPVDFENYYSPWRRWFHVKAYPSANGGLSVFYDDITERKAAEEALRESEERFRAIFDTTPQCVKVVGPDGALLQMNSAGLRMVGADSPDAVAGANVYDLIAPEFRRMFIGFNESVCAGRKGTLEFDIVDLKGRRKHMETYAAPLRRPDGTVTHLGITHDVTRRRSRERAAALLGAIVDSSDDAIVSKDLNGVITSWNRGAERLFGYTSAEAVGRPVTILIPEDRLGEEPDILSRLRRGECVRFETVRRRKDGVLLDIWLTVSPIQDGRGRIVGASKIARDITDRKRAERAIQNLNAQLGFELAAMKRMQQLSTRLVQGDDFGQLLEEIVDAGIEITGADMGNIQLLQDAVLRIVSQRGFDAPFLDFFNAAHNGGAASGAAMDRGERVVIEDVAESPVFADSPARQVMLAAGVRAVQSTPLRSRAGLVLGMFSTHYRNPRRPAERELRLLDLLARQAADLIEHKRAEAALLAGEARFRQLADAMPQFVWTARPDGFLDYYNEKWYEFTGFSRENFGDMSWGPILHPDDVKRACDTWSESAGSGRPYSIEYRFWDRRESRWRWFMGRALPIRSDEGAIVKWFGTCTDIDEQKRVEEELRGANQDLETFAYSASHDLQEPLRAVKIYGELLAKTCGPRLDGRDLELLGYLRTGATRMEVLVRDLLAYTQVTRLDPPSEYTDANEVLTSALDNLGSSVAESGARVTSDRMPSVRMHSAYLRQLFQNLIGNAIKYRHPDRAPQVHLSAERWNADYRFSVRDNGIGIESEYREYVFGLFKRLHPGDGYSGTGIGLAICQRIVERYRGRIWVESEPGKGSTFCFTIPA